ncbi:MAG: hypothetical protein WAQ08_09825 [Aquabacterium sp.]|uniref:hypothetical protein n=1 Tax=Aquabacterium sp. TaxID=1872578 RepID=UPI003BAFC34E
MPAYAPLLGSGWHGLAGQATQSDIATQQAELCLSRELLDALYQAHQLWLAERELQQDGTGPGAPPDLRKLHTMPLADALADSKTTPTQKEALYSAAGCYLDSLKRLEARCHQLELRRIAQAHERRLAYAEINALQWRALIDVSVNQVANASAGGIQAGHVVALLNLTYRVTKVVLRLCVRSKGTAPDER